MTKRTVTATEARIRFGDLLRRVVEQHETVVVERSGRPQAVVLSIPDYERLMSGRADDAPWYSLLDQARRHIQDELAGRELPPVRIELPDGSSVNSDSKDVARSLSAYFRRDVTLARAAPVDFTIDQYHPDLENLDPAGHRNEVMEQKLGSAFFAEAGLDSPVPPGLFFDLFPVTLLTTSTLEELNKLRPETCFDRRRFRMNLIINTSDKGFVENDWVGRALSIGDTLRIRVALPDPRCVMPTLAQEDLPRDNDVMRTLVRHNRLDAGGAMSPCAGVYAAVTSAGTIRTGDNVKMV